MSVAGNSEGAGKRQPWRKWYTRDWRADAPLRMCSYAARGLWADLLSLMHEANVCGFLLIEGVIPTARQLAGLLGGSEREVKNLLAELGQANVYSVTGEPMSEDVKRLIPSHMPPGVILSRRMVRDEAKAARDRQNGRGGGNPNVKGEVNPPFEQGVNRDDKLGVNPQANPQVSDARKKEIWGPLKGPPDEDDEKPSSVAARVGLEGPAHDAVQTLVDLATERARVRQ